MQAQVEISPAVTRQQHYDDLLAFSDGSANSVWLARIIASWLVGEGALPDRLGLTGSQFRQLLAQRFAGHELTEYAPSGKNLDFSRMLEKQDLEQLLRQFSAAEHAETEWLIAIIVAACLGSDHLWQDLGLWSRPELSAMLKHNFPRLAERNHKDMKWKKFLYKQLCEAEGLYVCRAPSCEVCQDYPQCFGPEE
ncbi:nitrogen fixation protein NifQ [Methylomonas rivi]|uniref:Nitrogen fixation protein NifQ n=1 Tax=Methylomonas rivi TaxID=2952226 RepID=A0ABT1U504_9GAMM|nr:nitrogen fixation protein NifQ [Methylomonas sp. WSC-6]MCQ8128938.1 nitrogen fixation protein NifQ [Methylomonas sp. WSC-6]